MKTMSYLQLAMAALLALATLSAHAGTMSYFIYDESGHVIGEYDANGNAVQEHVYLGDRPVAVVQGGGSGTVDYVTTDQLNTPRVITDSSQAVLWSWNSDPFGNGQPTATGSFTYNMRFPGQYYDQETGHSYNHTRDYDTSSGRYIESDPNGLRGGINTYAYAFDNPLGLSDKDGLAPSLAQNSGNKSALENVPDNKCFVWFASCINELFVCAEAECEYHDCKGHKWTITINAWIPYGLPTEDELEKLTPNCHCTKKIMVNKGDATEGL